LSYRLGTFELDLSYTSHTRTQTIHTAQSVTTRAAHSFTHLTRSALSPQVPQIPGQIGIFL